MDAQFKAVADHALLVSFGTEISDEAHSAVIALDKAITAAPPTGMIETVPALVNLLVDFDALTTDHERLQADIRALLSRLTPNIGKGITRVVQVCYEAPFSNDLSSLAQITGLSEEAVINAHLGGDYRVLMYGFAPGYAYLSGVADAIQVPRKPAAIRDVPAGSVIIAGPQCLVTTLTMPTGWSIIGRSPTKVLTSNFARPFLFDVGARVSFERINVADFDRLSKETTYG